MGVSLFRLNTEGKFAGLDAATNHAYRLYDDDHVYVHVAFSLTVILAGDNLAQENPDRQSRKLPLATCLRPALSDRLEQSRSLLT